MIEFEKVTTRGGDRGETSLYNGERRRKDDLLFETMGDVDELSSFLGVAKASCDDKRIVELISTIQRKLIDLGAQIATPKGDPLNSTITPITEQEVTALEKVEAEYLRKTEIGAQFVPPGENLLSAHFDVARTVCRRAERKIVACIRDRDMIQLASGQHYLNRLSDLLFILARRVAQRDGARRGRFGQGGSR